MRSEISAEYKGSFLASESWKGRIQSIYSKAVNLLHPSGILVSVVAGLEDISDYGLAVRDFNSFVSRISGDSRFLWKGSRIVFDGAVLDMEDAAVWSGRVIHNSGGFPVDLISEKEAFIELAAEEGFSPLVTMREGNLYSRAASRVLNNAAGSVNPSKGSMLELGSLIGMGVGFTPSGDDFLTGIMLYEAVTGRRLLSKTDIRKNLGRTTDGGRTLLSLALADSFPFYMKQFAEVLHQQGYSPHEAIKKALKHGATSGSDALTGFFWAAELN